MDVCKSCHEKDRNVIGCTKKMERHVNLSDYNDHYMGQVLDRCSICGKVVADLYFCSKYKKILKK